MGLTHVWVTIANPVRPRKSARVRLLVDSGIGYSVVPGPVLQQLGIRPRKKRGRLLSDGSALERHVCEATFTLRNESTTCPVVYGERGGASLLGSVTLEAMGLMLDPLQRQIRRMPLCLM